MATEIKYNDSVIATVEAGKTKILKCKGKKMRGDVEVKGGGGTSGFPIEIDALDNALLVSENAGKVYKCNDKLYQVHKITSLKGLTIKFNEHITPCPVIGEDDVFECSGVVMGGDLYPYIYPNRPDIIAIRKANDGAILETIISFTLSYNENLGVSAELVYGSYDGDLSAEWHVHDGYGNVFPAYAPAVIYNFDCSALNENPEFMEWVFANAKVYPNFESPNEIKSFKLNQQGIYGDLLKDVFYLGMQEANRTGAVFEFDVDGQFIATFSVNGELVTKTFTNVNAYGQNVDAYEQPVILIFSNDDDALSIEFAYDDTGGIITDENWVPVYHLRYNNIILEDNIIFTKFNCMLNTKTKDILSFILCYATIDGEYHNGFAFKEYESSLKEYDGTVEVK